MFDCPGACDESKSEECAGVNDASQGGKDSGAIGTSKCLSRMSVKLKAQSQLAQRTLSMLGM